MSQLDLLSYKGKRVAITGAATGMGAAATELLQELGADVTALDIAPIQDDALTAIKVDLGDKTSIDAALRQISGEVNAVFCVAGVPGNGMSALSCFTINYIAHVYLVEALLPQMPKGSSVTNISSGAGMGYMQEMQRLMPLIHTRGFEEAQAWFENDGQNEGYATSKSAMNLWTVVKAKEYGETYGVRINTVSPGVTESQLLPVFTEMAGGAENLKRHSGVFGRVAQPIEQAWPLVFLGSDAASFTTGAILNVDAGLTSSVFTGQLQMHPPE